MNYYIIGGAAVLILIVVILLLRRPDYTEVIKSIQQFNADYNALTLHYISTSQLRSLQDTYRSTYNAAPKKKFPEFNETYSSLPNLVKSHNAAFISSEITLPLLSDIEGKSLDEQQRTAIVTDEDHNLVIAGAGAGKTLTIAGKVKYLCDRQSIDPADILLLAFNKKAVNEMNERISRMGYSVKASTFHALGLNIITHKQHNRPDVFEDTDFKKFIDSFFSDRILKRPALMENLIKYFAYYLRIPADMDQFSSSGEAMEYEKNADFETLRSKADSQKGAKLTLQGEYVRSLQEL